MTVSVIQTSCTAKGGEPARFDIAWDESNPRLEWCHVCVELKLACEFGRVCELVHELGHVCELEHVCEFVVNLCIVIDSLLSVVCVYLPPFSK